MFLIKSNANSVSCSFASHLFFPQPLESFKDLLFFVEILKLYEDMFGCQIIFNHLVGRHEPFESKDLRLLPAQELSSYFL